MKYQHSKQLSGKIIEKKDYNNPIECPLCQRIFKDVYEFNFHYQWECTGKPEAPRD